MAHASLRMSQSRLLCLALAALAVVLVACGTHAHASAVADAEELMEWTAPVLVERGSLSMHLQESTLPQVKKASAPKKPKASPTKSKAGALLPGQFCPVSFGTAKPAGKPAKAGKVNKAKGNKRARTFLEMHDMNVPALTPAQLAQCAADQAAAAAAAKAKPAPGMGVGGKRFQELVGGSTNDQIWAPSISDRVKNCVADYKAQKRLPNGRVYGGAARSVDLTSKTVSQVRKALKKFQCKEEMQVLKNGTEPIVFAGKTIPMIVFLCPDGTAFRLKHQGDPSSKMRSQPHGVKALRYPFDTPFNTFDDEVIKVDARGYPVPKYGKDLAVFFPDDKAAQFDAMDGWANDAHANLAK